MTREIPEHPYRVAQHLADHAMQRATRSESVKLNRGLYTIRAVTTLAPFLGILGTLYQILATFGGLNGERFSIFLAIMHSLSESLMPTAFAILVSLIAYWIHQNLRNQTRSLIAETNVARLELVACLAHYAPHHPTPAATQSQDPHESL